MRIQQLNDNAIEQKYETEEKKEGSTEFLPIVDDCKNVNIGLDDLPEMVQNLHLTDLKVELIPKEELPPDESNEDEVLERGPTLGNRKADRHKPYPSNQTQQRLFAETTATVNTRLYNGGSFVLKPPLPPKNEMHINIIVATNNPRGLSQGSPDHISCEEPPLVPSGDTACKENLPPTSSLLPSSNQEADVFLPHYTSQTGLNIASSQTTSDEDNIIPICGDLPAELQEMAACERNLSTTSRSHSSVSFSSQGKADQSSPFTSQGSPDFSLCQTSPESQFDHNSPGSSSDPDYYSNQSSETDTFHYLREASITENSDNIERWECLFEDIRGIDLTNSDGDSGAEVDKIERNLIEECEDLLSSSSNANSPQEYSPEAQNLSSSSSPEPQNFFPPNESPQTASPPNTLSTSLPQNCFTPIDFPQDNSASDSNCRVIQNTIPVCDVIKPANMQQASLLNIITIPAVQVPQQATQLRPLLPKGHLQNPTSNYSPAGSTRAREIIQRKLNAEMKTKCFAMICNLPESQLTNPDSDGDTQLHIALSNRTEPELLYALVERLRDFPAALTCKNNELMNALDIAITEKKALYARYLAETMVDVGRITSVTERNDQGNTIVHKLCKQGDEYAEVLGQLLEAVDAQGKKIFNVNQKNNDGWTPLHMVSSASNDHMENVKLLEILMHNGSDPLAKEGKSGRIPFILAIESQSLQFVRRMLALARDPSKLLTTTDYQKNTALHRAASISAFSREKYMSLIEFLLRNGAPPNERNAIGRVPKALAPSELKEAYATASKQSKRV